MRDVVADEIFDLIVFHESVFILIEISLKVVFMGPLDCKSALVYMGSDNGWVPIRYQAIILKQC